jgi:hypothetical protein
MVIKGLLTAPTAPLSLAKVKMSSAMDISVAFLSQDTKAIHGVTANNEIKFRNRCKFTKDALGGVILLAISSEK